MSDSSTVSARVASAGTLRFYLDVLRTDPGKIVIGLYDTIRETARFIAWPRFAMPLTLRQRIGLVRRWAWAEVKIPGATTLLETIWLAYAASRATYPSREWIEVGCFKGLSTARLSWLAYTWGKHLTAHDTFAGLPGEGGLYRAVDGRGDYEFKAGSYAGTEREVIANVERYGRLDVVTLVEGEAGPALMVNPRPISFAFLDVDLVESYRACFYGLSGRIQTGTVIVVHEAAFKPIRDLIETPYFWLAIAIRPPRIEYVAERYDIRSCRNLAILTWL